MPLITAPEYPDVVKGTPIFLAGPITGAPDWQSIAAQHILKDNPTFVVFNPRRPPGVEFNDGTFNEQVDWETTWISRSRVHGCMLFWLSAPGPVEHPERAYAQTTRFELGECLGYYSYGSHRICMAVGGDDNFPGIKYIKYRLSFHNIHVCATLEETCLQAKKVAWGY